MRKQFYFYHTMGRSQSVSPQGKAYRNLKPMVVINFCADWEKIPNDLIRNGFAKGKSLKEQIRQYILFVEMVQNIKLYKIREKDQTMYVASILALYKLKQLDPDDPDSPFWISPIRKVRKLKN
jgi:hypothetical protein